MLRTVTATARHTLRTCPGCYTRPYSAASKSRSARPRPRPAAATPPATARAAPEPAAGAPPTSSAPPSSPAQPAPRPQPSWVRQPGPPSSSSSSSANPRPAQELREPPLVEAARKKSVSQRNVFESYLVLPWSTRLRFWLLVGAVGVVGLYGGDWLFPDEEGKGKGEGGGAVEGMKA
ncbi:hypothetical protein JCM6882_002638 [Rhodosporidiobolus microsporus]